MKTKQVFIWIVAICAFALLLLFSHDSLAVHNGWHLRFSLTPIYLYNIVFMTALTASVHFAIPYLQEKVSWLFLVGVFLKMGLFMMIFNTSIFSIKVLTMPERLSVFVPVMLFLVLESVLISRIITKYSN